MGASKVIYVEELKTELFGMEQPEKSREFRSIFPTFSRKL